eukprot:IDg7039t1
MLRKKPPSSIAIYTVANSQASISTTTIRDPDSGKDMPQLQRLLSKNAVIFKEELPTGLSPTRCVDHKIETNLDAKRPHRPLIQLSPAELLETKNYIIDLLKRDKIRPSRSRYGATMFFVKKRMGL